MIEFSVNVKIYNSPSNFLVNKARVNKVHCTEFTVTKVMGQQEFTPPRNVPFQSENKRKAKSFNWLQDPGF